jgi:hypothetical protein
MNHSDLLLYPIISVVMSAVVLALAVLSVLVWVDFDIGFYFELSWIENTLLTFVFYVLAYCVGIYTSTALVYSVLQLMHGEPLDMAAAWRLATSRLGAIFGYAVLMATVGMLLRIIFRPLGFAGKVAAPLLERTMVFTLVGLAWGAVPYFVVPVLIAERAGPLAAIRRSSHMIKEIWGDDVVVNASVWLIFTVPLVVVLLLGGPAIGWAISTTDELTVVLTVYAVVMLVLLTMLLKLALDGIFAAATYRYAVEKRVDAHFVEHDLNLAFTVRHSRLVNRVRQWLPRRTVSSVKPADIEPVSIDSVD